MQSIQGLFRLVQLRANRCQFALSLSKSRLCLISRTLIGDRSKKLIGKLIHLQLQRSLLVFELLDFHPKPGGLGLPFSRRIFYSSLCRRWNGSNSRLWSFFPRRRWDWSRWRWSSRGWSSHGWSSWRSCRRSSGWCRNALSAFPGDHLRASDACLTSALFSSGISNSLGLKRHGQ